MRHFTRRARGRTLLLVLILVLTQLASAQSFHASSSSKADSGAWRKLELWKEHLIDEANRTRVQLILDNQVQIRSGRSAALAETRNQISAVTGELGMMWKVLDSEYVVLELGYFDLYYPIWYLQKKAKVKELQRVSLGLLDLQGKFLDWVGLPEAARASEVESQPPVRTVLTELRAMYETWKPRALAPSRLDEAQERFEELNATDQSHAFADYMLRQWWMDEATSREATPTPEGVAPPGLHVLMAPDWQNFVGVACAFALMDEVEEVKEDGQRIADFVWFDNLPLWTYFYWYEYLDEKIGDFQIMVLTARPKGTFAAR